MNIQMKQRIKLLSGFVVLLFLGTTLAWSVFLVPVENTFGWSRSQTSLAATINTMAFSVGSILTGIMCKRISFANILRMTGIMLLAGFFFGRLYATREFGHHALPFLWSFDWDRYWYGI